MMVLPYLEDTVFVCECHGFSRITVTSLDLLNVIWRLKRASFFKRHDILTVTSFIVDEGQMKNRHSPRFKIMFLGIDIDEKLLNGSSKNRKPFVAWLKNISEGGIFQTMVQSNPERCKYLESQLREWFQVLQSSHTQSEGHVQTSAPRSGEDNSSETIHQHDVQVEETYFRDTIDTALDMEHEIIWDDE